MKKELYVQIPAYRDTELSSTLLDLFKKAASPQKIRVSVVWQHARHEKLEPKVLNLPNLELTAVPCEESLGCNWARRRLQRDWRGERYTLLLDSHHRFVRHWDVQLLGMFEALRRDDVKRPIITAYLPAYDPDCEPHGRMREVLKIYPLERENGLLTKLTSHGVVFWKELTKPLPANFLSLHFLFAEGRFNEDVEADPEIYFFGDEVVTSLRAFTLGYDFFHPHRLLGWHLYDRKTRVPHWKDHQSSSEMAKRSIDKIRTIYDGTFCYDQRATRVRSIKQYEARIQMPLIA